MFARKTLPFALLLALALPAVGSEQDSSATNDDTPNAVQSSVLKAARPQNNASILVGQSLENDIFEFTEVLRTRYPSGAVQIERHIRRDQNNEPINHGKWTMYTPEGDQIAHGTFCDGRPHGTWSRTYRGDEAKTILGASGQGFTLPLHSTATFPMGFSMANGLSSTMSSERSACGLLIERNSMGLRWSGTRVAIVFAKRNTTREYPPGSTGNGRRKENSWRATHFALGDCFRSTVRRMTTAMSNQRAATCSPAIALQPTSGGGTAM